MTKRNILLRKCMTIMLSVALVFTMMPMVPGAVEKVHAEGELLPAPTITIDKDGVATWTEVEGASKYFWMISTGGGFADPVEGINIPQNLASWGTPGGTYTLQITARDADNNAISETASIDYVYENTHEHSWASAWSSDATHHWHECTVVGCPLDSDSAKDGYGEHVYLDNVCASCGKILELKAAPTITIDGSGVATWDAVEGASEYNVACSSFGGFVDTPSYNLAEKLAYYNEEPGVYTLQVYAVDADRNKITETATAKYDTRTVVDTFTGTSTIKAPVYGEAVTSVYDFKFTSEVNAEVPDSMGNWYKKNGETWERYEGSVFTEGTYYYSNQLRLDSASGTGATHKLADTLHITINGDIWTNNEPWIDNTYSYAYMKSPEYVVEKTALELEFIDNASFDIQNVYQNRAVTSYSVADAVVGGTEPYVFSKTSGPDWITVAEDGTVSGTPDAIGTNEKLVIKVTDALGAYKEITIDVDATLMNPADREVADTFVATSTFKAPAYGDAVATVYNFNFTSEVNARVPVAMGGWYKKVDGEWVEYTAPIFGVGEYFYTNQLRLDLESGTGSTHQLPKDENISITINGETWTCDSEAWIDDTYSYVYMDSPVYVVRRELPENITLSQESYTYDGTAKEPEVTVGDLVKETDYTVSYSNNTNAGIATITIDGKGNYKGTITKNFTIERADVNDVTVTLDHDTFAYTGASQGPNITVKDGEKTLAADTDYTISGNTIGTAAGTYTFTIEGKGNYEGSIEKTFTINPCTHDWDEGTVTKNPTCSETGTKVWNCEVPGCEATKSETIPVDKDAHPAGNIKDLPAKEATCKEAGLTAGKQCTACGTETVKQISVPKLTTHTYGSDNKCTVCGEEKPGTGGETTPDPGTTPGTGGSTGGSSGDGTTPDPGTAPGTGMTPDAGGSVGTVTPTPTPTPDAHQHSYVKTITKATAKKDGSIVEKCACGDVKSSVVIKKASGVKLSKSAYVYTGKVIKAKNLPKVIVKDSAGKTIAKSNYTIVKPKNVKKMKALGKYAYTIKFKGDKYKGSVKVYLEITPAKVTAKAPKAAKKAVTVTWKKGKKAQVTGYQVTVATNKAFTKNVKTKKIKGYGKASFKMTKLKAKTKYYVKVRAYKTTKTGTVYGPWSAVKNAKTK